MDNQPQRLAFLSDFDGTLTDLDTGELALDLFSNTDWRRFDLEFERGEVDLEEALRREFSSIDAPFAKIRAAVLPRVKLRAGAKSFINYCRNSAIRFTVVSGGLDFLIRPLLRREGLEPGLKVVAPRTRHTTNGITLTFPKHGSLDFKGTLVESQHRRGHKVAYAGDGISDFGAIAQADIRFVVKGSRLAAHCRQKHVEAFEVEDFVEIKSIVRSLRPRPA